MKIKNQYPKNRERMRLYLCINQDLRQQLRKKISATRKLSKKLNNGSKIKALKNNDYKRKYAEKCVFKLNLFKVNLLF